MRTLSTLEVSKVSGGDITFNPTTGWFNVGSAEMTYTGPQAGGGSVTQFSDGWAIIINSDLSFSVMNETGVAFTGSLAGTPEADTTPNF